MADGALRLPWAERVRVLAAFAELARASLVLRMMPFQRAIESGSVPLEGSTAEAVVIDDWVRALNRASYGAPWRNVCIHRGLALQRLLRSRGVPAILCYGANPADDALKAHVWVKVGDRIVIGAEEAGSYAQLATYPRDAA
nr:lasso peptide biosynthesis B2 protein [Sphingomonas sabuli]